jgi:DNA-binding transcriptional regulator YiaG
MRSMSSDGKWDFGPFGNPGPRAAAARVAIAGLDDDPLPQTAIRAVRDERALTQAELASLLGVSLRTVKAWEHTDRNNAEARNCTGAARKLLVLLARHDDVLELLRRDA